MRNTLKTSLFFSSLVVLSAGFAFASPKVGVVDEDNIITIKTADGTIHWDSWSRSKSEGEISWYIS